MMQHNLNYYALYLHNLKNYTHYEESLSRFCNPCFFS